MANSSSYSHKGIGGSAPVREYQPAVDKDRVYRTNTIFKGAYKKNISVKDGTVNQTDCKSTVWVKFLDPVDVPIIEDLGKHNSRQAYRLACGHVWEGKLGLAFTIGTEMPCNECGADQGYLGFEHEWQHILFKTNPDEAKLFIGPWADELIKDAPYVDKEKLEKFLFLIINAFDDIRVNSLWELLYAGSADSIWKRWTRISNKLGPERNATNFIAFLFSVALGTQALPDGPFEPMRDDIKWGMEAVKYKGYQRALVLARISLNRCLKKILAEIPPPQQSNQPNDNAEEADGTNGKDEPAEGSSVVHQSSPGAGENQEPSTDGTSGPGQKAQEEDSQANHTKAINQILSQATPFDEQETHYLPPTADPYSLPETVKAAVAKALQADDSEEADLGITPDEIDTEMQDVIDDFRDGISKLSPDSQLMANAKAKIRFLDVLPEGLVAHSRVLLNSCQNETVDKLRGTFYRTLGRQKSKRSSSGLGFDIDAAIQYDIEPSDPEIFESEQNNQGFAYMTLCDMSGSMEGSRFGQVCTATEILKKALKFPFVEGSLWGFRGGQPLRFTKLDTNNEVWIYRYDKSCDGYIGTARSPGSSIPFPVSCGGLTPMHSAVRVAVRHLLTQVAPGMAKRLFLLTDGSPCGTKMSGQSLPHYALQQFVAKEIQWARQKGIHVYTMIIDGGMEEKECRLMFGPPQYWRNVYSQKDEQSIERELQKLVLQNFERYLKTRG